MLISRRRLEPQLPCIPVILTFDLLENSQPMINLGERLPSSYSFSKEKNYNAARLLSVSASHATWRLIAASSWFDSRPLYAVCHRISSDNRDAFREIQCLF